jgi:hypothetical protein
LQHVRVLVEGRDVQQVCTVLLLGTLCWALLCMGAAAAACCRVSRLLPLLLSVCDMILVQNLCQRSQQLQQQFRHCGISQQLTARHLNIGAGCYLLSIYVLDKLS